MTTIVDTTLVADALLKTDTQRRRAKSAIQNIPESLLPVYAIKEFKRGPLHYYVWYHNKAVEASSWQEAVTVIRNNMGHRRNLPATALQALGDFLGSIGKELPADIGLRYPGMNLESAQLAELRIWLKQHVTRAWRKRRTLTTAVINPLPCYVETDARTRLGGQLDDNPVNCGVMDCSLRDRYRNRLADVRRLEQACTATKKEVVERRKALARLRSHPTKPYAEEYCRALGDAVFALDCPAGGEILTTNVVDHQPLADALNLTVRAP